MTDDRLEQIIGNLLRAGVGLSAATVATGGVWYLAVHGAATPQYRVFDPHVRGLAALHTISGPEALILIGLLILIATPIARVVFCVVGFALERDRTYVGFSLVVLAVLLYTVLAATV